MQQRDDDEILSALELKLYECCGGKEKLIAEVPQLLRKAIDEVIDPPRTARLLLEQLEKTEKTYLGTKVEILIRKFFNVPKGVLDLEIDGQDVDVKNTVNNTWMIPKEAIGKPCILVQCSESNFKMGLGLLVAHPHNLTTGKNQDGKHSVSARGKTAIRWLLRDHPYPPNFWANVDAQKAQYILTGKSGNECVERLFTTLLETPIPRYVIEAVAPQKDFMRRIRKNGGARDRLAQHGVSVLTGFYDRAKIASLGLPAIRHDEFISVRENRQANVE